MNAKSIKDMVFAAVPAYREARWATNSSRVHTSYSEKEKSGFVALGIGLLSPDAEAVFDKVGTLKTTKQAIVKEMRKHFKGLKTTEVYTDVKDRYCHGFYFDHK